MRTINVIMIDGRFINGEAYAPGARVSVPAHEAHEIVAQGWARFQRAEDEAAARAAFVAAQDAVLRRLNSPAHGGSPSWPAAPWQRYR